MMSWGSGVAVLLCSICLLFGFKWLLVKLGTLGSQKNSERVSTSLMVVLGSGRFTYIVLNVKIGAECVGHVQKVPLCYSSAGGHTAEMIHLLHSMDLKNRFPTRCYVVAETDPMSEEKARLFEKDRQQDFVIDHVPRSREVGQKYATSVLSTLHALVFAAMLVLRHRPRVLLVNGPGTCLPIAFCCKILCSCQVVYIESIARVDKLSLTGRILYVTKLADIFYVQWEELQQRLPRSKYVGRVY